MKNVSFLSRKSGLLLLLFIFISSCLSGQNPWPLTGKKGQLHVTVFKPVTENFQNNDLAFRAAIAMTQNNQDPVFGSIWGNAKTGTTGSANRVTLSYVNVSDVRFPDGITENQKRELIQLIQQTFSDRRPELSMSEIRSDLDQAEKENQFSSSINHNPPKIIYTQEYALLVTVDGEPIVQNTSTMGIDAVVNTPFLILKYQNNYYLSNGQLWYRASNPTGNYIPERNPPSAVKTLAQSLKTNEEAVAENRDNTYPKIIVSTVPAELIQTEGEAVFSAIQGTDLLYVSNTEEQILFDIRSQSYYVLLSGRWYTSKNLTGGWSYVDPQNLPTDFARIPEGSDKDVVLANIPGTSASHEAVRDALVPHTAVVNRNTATTTTEVTYDGEPVFETIEGTDIRLATNSSGTVLYENNRYYLVDNGIWFVSSSPKGPWTVSDSRPQQVTDIPPSSPAYNVKYVNIYHSTPEIVYVGYTSGYVSNYIVGPTIVYGTGYRYHPWRGNYYYPRPCTWGFGMYYNPWYGWCMNIGYGIGGYGWFGFYSPWFYPHWGYHAHPGWGWWGPPVYRPPYGTPYNHYYGHRPASNRPIRYGNNNIVTRKSAEAQQINNNNIYNQNRKGVAPLKGYVAPGKSSSAGENLNYSKRARPQEISKEVSRPVNKIQNPSRLPEATTPANNQTIKRDTPRRSGNRETVSPGNRLPNATRQNNQNLQNQNRRSSQPANTNRNTNNRLSSPTPQGNNPPGNIQRRSSRSTR